MRRMLALFDERMIMPTYGGYYYGFSDANPRLWERCKKTASAQMIAEGWKTYAGTFDMVMQKRARRLWNMEHAK